MTHEHRLRVYYEDTDMAGVVYYANYLRFLERGRTEAVRSVGVDQGELCRQHDIVFAVRRLSVEFISPARFDDLLTVCTVAQRVRGASVAMNQTIMRQDRTILTADVQVVCMTTAGRPMRLPANLRQRLNGLAVSES